MSINFVLTYRNGSVVFVGWCSDLWRKQLPCNTLDMPAGPLAVQMVQPHLEERKNHCYIPSVLDTTIEYWDMITSYPKCKAGRCPWWCAHSLCYVCVSPTLLLEACTIRLSAPPQLEAHSDLTRQEMLLQTDEENEIEENKGQTITTLFGLLIKTMPAGHQNSWCSQSDGCCDDYHVCLCVCMRVLPTLWGPNVTTRKTWYQWHFGDLPWFPNRKNMLNKHTLLFNVNVKIKIQNNKGHKATRRKLHSKSITRECGTLYEIRAVLYFSTCACFY